jgi:hypothetical protein
MTRREAEEEEEGGTHVEAEKDEEGGHQSDTGVEKERGVYGSEVSLFHLLHPQHTFPPPSQTLPFPSATPSPIPKADNVGPTPFEDNRPIPSPPPPIHPVC